jgi:hypothetical protein
MGTLNRWWFTAETQPTSHQARSGAVLHGHDASV